MKILILGRSGNLGSQLSLVFSKEKNCQTVGWDKEDADIGDEKLISEKITKLAPDIIINAAAYNAVDLCQENEQELKKAHLLNAKVPEYLARIARENDSLFVHYSTDYVFPGDNSKGYAENSRPNPINEYGRTKAEGEKNIAREALKGLKWYIIRTSKLFGPRGKSESSKPSFFDIMLKLSREKEEIKAVEGEKSCFTYTPDLAKATKNLINSKKNHGIYHICNSEPATWYEAAAALFSIAGIKKKLTPVPAKEFPRPAPRPEYSVLINTKLPPLPTYQDALKQYLRTLHKEEKNG